MLKRIAKGNLLFLKPTRSFPLSTLNEKISIEKLVEMKGTIELLQSQKLKEIQKKYISDSNNLRTTYEYIRVFEFLINRNLIGMKSMKKQIVFIEIMKNRFLGAHHSFEMEDMAIQLKRKLRSNLNIHLKR